MYNSDMPTRAQLPSNGQLIRSTLIALVSAALILVTVILPAEYAIDPTGVGRALGLTEMGEIKAQLEQEAKEDEARAQALASKPVIQKTVVSTTAVEDNSASAAEWKDRVLISLKPGQGLK